MMPDGVCQMCFAEPYATVKKQRIVFVSRPVTYRAGRGMRELIARADDELIEREAWIEFRVKRASLPFGWTRPRSDKLRGLSFAFDCTAVI